MNCFSLTIHEVETQVIFCFTDPTATKLWNSAACHRKYLQFFCFLLILLSCWFRHSSESLCHSGFYKWIHYLQGGKQKVIKEIWNCLFVWNLIMELNQKHCWELLSEEHRSFFNTAIAKVALRTAIKCGQCLSQVCCATLSLRWMQCFECTYTACYTVCVENKVKPSHSLWLKVSEFHHLCRSLISLGSLWKWKANGPLTKQILESNIVLQLWYLFCRLLPEGETCREITIFTWNKAKQLVSVHFGTTPALKTSGQGQKYWRPCPALKAHNLPDRKAGETWKGLQKQQVKSSGWKTLQP